MFQKRNPRGDYVASEVDGMNARAGDLGAGHKRNASNNLNKSNSKPPLSGRKGDRKQRDEEDEINKQYGPPYNINGVVHPGVNSQVRQMNAGYGYSDQSDNEARMRRSFNDSDLEVSGKKRG